MIVLKNPLAKRKSENKATWNSLEETLLSDNLDSYNQAVELCRQLIGPVEDNSPAKQIEAAIAHLVKLCTDNKDYSFRNLQSQRVLRAENVANVNVAEMPKANIVDGIYECPVALDNDLPTLPINRGDGVLSHLDAKYQDYLVSMPLATLENPQLVTAIRNRFGKVIGHGSLCELYKRDRVPQDPQTRMPIVSVLIPHLPNDERERKIYSKSIDHALASILFGNKLVGQPGLWLAVIWQCIKSTPYLSEDAPFMSVFESFLVSYWRTYSTRITLTGLVVEPMINTSISLAMWYCLSSFDINFSANSKMDDERNRLRALGPVARHFIPCIELLKYSYDKDFIQRQIGIYQAFAWMMDQEKTPDSNWRNMIRACWQNSVILENGNIILLDGPPRKDAKLPEEISHLSLGTVISLMNLVDKTKKTSEIFISRKLEESPIPSFVTNYGYPELTEEVLMKKIPICSQTCRPYYVDRKIKKKWDDCAKCYGPLDKQCHNYRLFIDFVFGKDRYPQSVSEFILYASEKQANRLVNPVDTLPLYEPIFVKNMFLDYEEVLGKDFKDVSVKDFKTRVWKSMNEKERASIDGSVQFI